MRREFAKFVEETVIKDKRVHLLSLDGPGYGLFDNLVSQNPGNYWNLGVMEQASIGVAAGMALEGLKPYVYSITPFILERPFEQVKLDIVEQKADVKLISFWNYPRDGPTHTTKDPEGLCKILGIRFFKPKNSNETRELLLETYHDNEPAFFYLTKNQDLRK
jgi:transketolase